MLLQLRKYIEITGHKGEIFQKMRMAARRVLQLTKAGVSAMIEFTYCDYFVKRGDL
jgi:hypothetical protein